MKVERSMSPKTNRRRAKHLIRLAFGQSDIMTIANKILNCVVLKLFRTPSDFM